MKRVLTAAAALSMLAGPAVSLAAQDHHDDRGGGAQRSAPAAAPAPQPRSAQGGVAQGGPPGGGYHPPTQGAYRAQPQTYQGAQPGYRQQGDAPVQGRYQAQGGYQSQARPAYQGQQTSRGAPGAYQQGYQGRGAPVERGPRPGAQAFAYGGRSFYRYHASPYAFPGGYGGWDHHYWRRGEFLPSVFFLPNYFISDYWSYGLWAPDYGYQWIRVGADALLINLATGEVVDSVPGVYYW